MTVTPELTNEQKTMRMADNMAGYMLSCRVKNQPEWMQGMVEKINDYIIAIGGDERYQFKAGGFCLIEGKQ